LQSTPATGQLDSDAFKISGLTNSGTPALFGSSYTSQTKFARGESIGGVSSASGLYAFTVASGNNALGIQPGQGGTEFNPGKIIFRFQNTTGEEITSLSISYKVYAYNDKARSTRVDFYHGASESTLTQETNLNFETPEVADANPKWESTYLKTDLENLSIQNNGVYYLIWNSEDLLPVSTGARDEFALDDIEIIANPTTLTSQLEGLITNIRMDGDIALRTPTYMTGNLSIFNGNFKTNNFLTLKSSATKTASIGDLSNGSITGLVTTERYMSKKRAFRFVSSSVTSITSIRNNWQEGATSNTANPKPGFGIHITGSVSGDHGFDATPSGNPSLFGYDNTNQQWDVFTNTDTETIKSGKAYRLMVRGDRSVDVTDNETPPTTTIIRARGVLNSGSVPLNTLSSTEGDYNFVGNPYQAVVNIESVMANSTNINNNNYYVWNATYFNNNDRGKYETIDLNDPNGLRLIQPGQAIFVRTLANGNASLLFEQTDKVIAETANTVFRTENKTKIFVELFRQENLANNYAANDELTINFTDNDLDDVLPKDATKLGNLDENLAVVNGSSYLSLEYRSMPDQYTELPLFINQLRSLDYTFKTKVENLEGYTAYLADAYTGVEHELQADAETLVTFQVDPEIESSVSTDRFKIIFKENVLGVQVDDNVSFSMYPNPMTGSSLNIVSSTLGSENTQVAIYNQLGQLVFTEEIRAVQGRLDIKNVSLSSGLFIVQLSNDEGIWTKKLIVE